MNSRLLRHWALFAVVLIAALPAAAQQGAPAGYVQSGQGGEIQAIHNPTYVPAAAAQVRDDAWVLGVVIDGQARAYSLELLNNNHIVNDAIGDTHFAAVWSPIANTAVVYDRNYDGRTLTFESSGGSMNASLVMQDRETDSYWSVMSGKAEAGELAGTMLAALPVSERMAWAEWIARHPDTLVLSVMRSSPDGNQVAVQDPGTDTFSDYYASEEAIDGVEATDRRLGTKQRVHAFVHNGVAYAVNLRRVVGGKAFELEDGTHVLVYREITDGMFRSSVAFSSTAGFEQRGGSWVELQTETEFNAITRDFGGAPVPRLNGFDTFWYTWSLAHPDTELFR